MEITINDQAGNPAYLIKPHGNGLCFELHRWMDEKQIPAKGDKPAHIAKAGYKPLGRYPSNIDDALRSVAQMITKDDPTCFEAATCEAIMELARGFRAVINGYGRELS